MDELYTTVQEAARLLAVSPQTVRRLIGAGHLTARRLTPAPHSAYRVTRESLLAYTTSQNRLATKQNT